MTFAPQNGPKMGTKSGPERDPKLDLEKRTQPLLSKEQPKTKIALLSSRVSHLQPLFGSVVLSSVLLGSAGYLLGSSGAPPGLSWCSLGLFGACWRPSWASLGALLGPLGGLLGLSWASLGASWASLGTLLGLS